jgi:hypothetical protein
VWVKKNLVQFFSEVRKIYIGRAVTAGTLHSPWMNPQGLYHLTRNCANQLLRHLLRTVCPTITTELFKPLDEATMKLVTRIFEIRPEDLTEAIKTMLVLPGALGGFGLATYTDAAPTAFLGCIAKISDYLPSELYD